ncbi:hypothetical protein [Kribbella speibonae]|uniref:hypothetical protein n=1 Tax=Kribbella speibonae TaxID=1572660 RepID=UPI0013F4B8C5|nr:hypothetical protein [Kribbella speibonae]
MDQSKTVTPARHQDEPPDGGRDDRDPWHKHPALVATIPVVGALIGSALTIVLGQADVLPTAINPAPPQTTVLSTTTATATTTATSTVTETVTETPTVAPTEPQGSSAPPVVAPGNLAITVQMTTGGKIGPGEYRAGSWPSASAQVLDVSGRYPGTGCYPTWVLKRGSTVIKTARSESCRASFPFNADSLEVRGVYHLTVSVVTDAGAKGTGTMDFKVT